MEYGEKALEKFNELNTDIYFAERIDLSWDSEAEEYSLRLVMHPFDEGESLEACFLGVAEFTLSEFGGGLRSLGVMKLKRLENGWDRLKYEAFQVEGKYFRFYFRQLELV